MKRALRIVISTMLVGILLWHADWSALRSHLSELNLKLTGLAFLLLTAQYPVGAWKWKKSLEAHGIRIGFPYLLRVLCYGFFFNNFLPTAIGGDAYRVYRTIQPTTGKFRSISAVFVERIIGLLSLAFIGAICAVQVLAADLVRQRSIVLVGLAATVTVPLLLILAYRTKTLRFAGLRLLKKASLTPVIENMQELKRNSSAFLDLVLISILSQVIAVFAVTILFSALNTPFPLAQSGFTAAVAAFGSVLPLSVNGIGIVEGFFVLAALEVSLPVQQALVVAIFLRGYMVLSSVIFGIFYALDPTGEKATEWGARRN